MKTLICLLVSLPLAAQNYVSYNNQPVARVSFLRHQLFQAIGDLFGDSSILGYWPLNEGNGVLAYDSSGNGRNGVWHGSITGTNGYFSAGKSAPWSGAFNGSNVSVQVPTISVSGNISVAAWVYSSSFNQNGMIVEKDPVNTQWEVFFQTGSPALLLWRGGGVAAVTCSTPSNSNWHHIAATQTGTTATLYIDGAACASAGTVSALANGSGIVNIGRYGPSYFFNGKIADVRIYSRVLSPSEIQTIYNASNH